MRHVDLVAGFLATLVAACAGSAAEGPRSGAGAARAADLVVTGATLLDGTGAPPRPGTTIFVRGDRIVAIEDDAEAVVPAGARVLDAAGRIVIPGLADLHVHFGTGGFEGRDEGTTERVLRQFLFYGVTTILNLGATGGRPDEILELRRRQEEGELTAPEIHATGGLITVPGSHPVGTIMFPPEGADPSTYDWAQRGVWVVASPAEAREVVSRLAAAGMDGIKIVVESGPTPFGDDHPQMPPEIVEAVVAEARRHALSVYAHASSVDELEVAVEAGVRAVVHLVHDPGVPSPELLARMHEKDVYYLPTLSVFISPGVWGDPAESLSDPFLRAGVEERVIESLLRSPRAPTAPPSAEDWENRRRVLRALRAAHDAGVKVVSGTDTANPFVFPGYSVHHELALMVEAGLTPMEALLTATRRPAEMLGKDDELGTIEPGKRADMLILAADPLADIRNTRTLETVIRNGRPLDRAALLTAAVSED